MPYVTGEFVYVSDPSGKPILVTTDGIPRDYSVVGAETAGENCTLRASTGAAYACGRHPPSARWRSFPTRHFSGNWSIPATATSYHLNVPTTTERSGCIRQLWVLRRRFNPVPSAMDKLILLRADSPVPSAEVTPVPHSGGGRQDFGGGSSAGGFPDEDTYTFHEGESSSGGHSFSGGTLAPGHGHMHGQGQGQGHGHGHGHGHSHGGPHSGGHGPPPPYGHHPHHFPHHHHHHHPPPYSAGHGYPVRRPPPLLPPPHFHRPYPPPHLA